MRRYGLFHIVYSNHEECDAWMLDRDDGSITFRKNADGLIHVEDFANYEASCVADDVGTADRGQEWDLVLIPPSPLLMEIRGVRLGGLPVWWQGNDWPDCPECGKSMFYIAGIRAIQVPPDNGCGDQLLNAF
ncbi:MAG: hypothetical protein HY042_05850, partial [Spirochaetia bacterium]|nr:hypothetical protein [Spirochaetia bacterium]